MFTYLIIGVFYVIYSESFLTSLLNEIYIPIFPQFPIPFYILSSHITIILSGGRESRRDRTSHIFVTQINCQLVTKPTIKLFSGLLTKLSQYLSLPLFHTDANIIYTYIFLAMYPPPNYSILLRYSMLTTIHHSL